MLAQGTLWKQAVAVSVLILFMPHVPPEVSGVSASTFQDGGELAISSLQPRIADSAEARSRLAKPIASSAAASFGNVSLHFEPNLGQAHEGVAFTASASGYQFFLTPEEAVFVIQNPVNQFETVKIVEGSLLDYNRLVERAPIAQDVVRMRFVDANPDPQISGEQRGTGKSNYFVGNNPTGWATNVLACPQSHPANWTHVVMRALCTISRQ
jgi:hypothetical protein